MHVGIAIKDWNAVDLWHFQETLQSPLCRRLLLHTVPSDGAADRVGSVTHLDGDMAFGKEGTKGSLQETHLHSFNTVGIEYI